MIPTVRNVSKQLNVLLDDQHMIFAYELAAYWQHTRHMELTERLMKDVILGVIDLSKNHDVHTFAEWVEFVNLECQ